MDSKSFTCGRMSAVSYLSFGMVKVGTNNNFEVNWYLILYYIVCILIAANIAGWLWNRGQTSGAIITLALLLLVFVFFGLRWFNTPDPRAAKAACAKVSGTGAEPDTVLNPWPPSVNMCPDFMVAYTESTGRLLCYDVNNTYEMKEGTGAGLTTGLAINGVPGQSAYVMKDPAQGNANTKLETPEGTNRWPILGLIGTDVMISDPRGKYVRWEGVFDGTTKELGKIARSLP
jgi:hypothetical protein